MIEQEREWFGRLVRDLCITWAKEQPNPKDYWLVPWEQLDEPLREADRRIGEGVADACLGAAFDLMVNSVLECLNSAFRADPAAMAMLLCSRVHCNEALQQHPDVPVNKFRPVDGVCMVGVLSLVNGVLHAMQLPEVEAVYESDGSGVRRMTGFRLWEKPQEQAPAEPEDATAAESSQEPIPQSAPDKPAAPQWNAGWNSTPTTLSDQPR